MLGMIIETATERGGVAIIKDGRVIAQKDLPFGLNNSKYLFSSIEETLKESGFAIKECSWIAVGAGPGSYTGIRVGVAAAKGFSFAASIPLIGFCSLEAFVPSIEGAFAVIFDARIGGAYYLIGELKNGNIHYTSEPAILEIDKLADAVKHVKTIVTPNVSTLKVRLEAALPDHLWIFEEKAPNFSHLADLALKKYQIKAFSQDASLEVIYLRQTEAERNNQARQGESSF